MLCMQVYRNLSLVDEYWLKYGNYHVTVETKSKDADFLLKYPKCPVSCCSIIIRYEFEKSLNTSYFTSIAQKAH